MFATSLFDTKAYSRMFSIRISWKVDRLGFLKYRRRLRLSFVDGLNGAQEEDRRPEEDTILVCFEIRIDERLLSQDPTSLQEITICTLPTFG